LLVIDYFESEILLFTDRDSILLISCFLQMKIDRIQNDGTLTVTRVEKSIRIAFDLGHDIVLIFDARGGELLLICPIFNRLSRKSYSKLLLLNATQGRALCTSLNVGSDISQKWAARRTSVRYVLRILLENIALADTIGIFIMIKVK
jgi:hypothetical protein